MFIIGILINNLFFLVFFFIYDWSAMRILKTELSPNILEFVIRLCAIIGGSYVFIGILYFGFNRFLTLIKTSSTSSSLRKNLLG